MRIWLGLMAKAERLAESLAQTYKTALTAQASVTSVGLGSGQSQTGDEDTARAAYEAARTQLAIAYGKLAAGIYPGSERHSLAMKAATSALGALRALGFVFCGADISSDDGRGVKSNAVCSDSSSLTQASASGAGTASAGAGANTDVVAPVAPVVVAKWGYVMDDVLRILEELLHAYKMAGASAALVDAAHTHMRAAYRMAIGKDEVMIDRAYPNLTVHDA
jgi:multidrug efflux pump subunit AcrA (membrane-fusion protein)